MLVLNRLAQRLCGKSIVGLMFACLKTIKIHFVMYSFRPSLDGDIQLDHIFVGKVVRFLDCVKSKCVLQISELRLE